MWHRVCEMLPISVVASIAVLLFPSSDAFLSPQQLPNLALKGLPSRLERGASAGSQEGIKPLPSPPAVWEDGLPPSKYAQFLEEFWQQRPLLIRRAFDPSVAVVGPGELLALACDGRAPSRLIEHWALRNKVEAEEEGCHGDEGATWSVRQGPFDEEDFQGEGDEGEGRTWTVLVQEVDRHVPEVGDLLQSFRFLPNWRVDDIMISYAPQAGGIGPHVDNYDVFLLQGRGTRKWSIQNALMDRETEARSLIPHNPLRVLASFRETHAWTLEPGDLLYLPPRVPHDGVSLDQDCMTYSIGFRAPTQEELLEAATAAAVSTLREREAGPRFYVDPHLPYAQDVGEITPVALKQVRGLVQDALAAVLDDDALLARWAGRSLTGPKHRSRAVAAEEGEEYGVWMEREEARAVVQELLGWESSRETEEKGATQASMPRKLYRAEGLKFAHADGGRLLFVDGHVWDLRDEDEERRRRICNCLTGGASPFPLQDISSVLRESLECVDVVTEWLMRGFLYVVEENCT